MWHRGGGHKRLYRIIDFKRRLIGLQGHVRRIEYDPNRSARIALIDYVEGYKLTHYIIAPEGLKVRPRRAARGVCSLALAAVNRPQRF